MDSCAFEDRADDRAEVLRLLAVDVEGARLDDQRRQPLPESNLWLLEEMLSAAIPMPDAAHIENHLVAVVAGESGENAGEVPEYLATGIPVLVQQVVKDQLRSELL